MITQALGRHDLATLDYNTLIIIKNRCLVTLNDTPISSHSRSCAAFLSVPAET